MAVEAQAGPQTSDLQELAKRHLWMHFTPMGGFRHRELPIIVRGEGCYVYDDHGKRYLDGLAALFCVNIGHGRADVAQAGADQAKELGFYTNWSYAHPRAIELAARIAGLAPGDLNRVFFTSGGSESVDSALKLCRQYHKLTGNAGRFKVISRKLAYHGTTLGALTATGMPDRPRAVRAAVPRLGPRAQHQRLPARARDDARSSWPRTIREQILFEDPETVSCVILEPVQNSGGCFTAPPEYFQRVREICDEFGVLFISDEVICSWGRLGEYFGAEKLGYQPDIITTAKGLTSAYAPMGAVIASDRVAEPFMAEENSFSHGLTFGGHPITAAVALANLDVFENEGILENVREHEGEFVAMLDVAARHPDRRRRARHGLLPRDRAGQGPRDQGDLQRRGVRLAAARPAHAGPLRARADLPRRRPRRPGHPVLAAADRRPRAVRRDGGRPAARARGRLAAAGPALDVLTLRELIRDLDVRRRGGRGGLDRAVRWVHISELLDPTPWLSGGELLLTTGLQLERARAAARVPRPAGGPRAGRAGLRHRLRPRDGARAAARDAADAHGFPLFEVPYEVPFIAVTEQAFSSLVNEHYAVLQRAISAHERLERIVLSERGLDGVAGALAALIGGPALILDARGELLARRAAPRARSATRPSRPCAPRCASARAAAPGAASSPRALARRPRAAGAAHARPRRRPGRAAGVARGGARTAGRCPSSTASRCTRRSPSSRSSCCAAAWPTTPSAGSPATC